MSPLNFTHILTQTVDELSESESYKGLFHQHTDGNPLPYIINWTIKNRKNNIMRKGNWI